MRRLGQVHVSRIYFQGDRGRFKNRPVLVVKDTERNLYQIAQITSVPPKNPPKYHDQYKVKIKNWKELGLDKPSWVNCYKKNMHRISGKRLNKYIGHADNELMRDVIRMVSSQRNKNKQSSAS